LGFFGLFLASGQVSVPASFGRQGIVRESGRRSRGRKLRQMGEKLQAICVRGYKLVAHAKSNCLDQSIQKSCLLSRQGQKFQARSQVRDHKPSFRGSQSPYRADGDKVLLFLGRALAGGAYFQQKLLLYGQPCGQPWIPRQK
jgi:hypothetical protein